MKVRALKQFNDLTEMKFRRKYDEFGVLVEVIEDIDKEIKAKPKRNVKK